MNYRRFYKVTYYKLYGLLYTLARLFSSHWHDCSTITGAIAQQSLARLFNSHWQNCLTVAGTIVQQSLGRLFKSH